MKTKNNLLIFCTLFFLALSGIMNAQSNFKKGFILTNANDTVYGLIDFRTDAMNAEQCKFRTGEGKADMVYYPGDIAGYRFSEEGKFYVSRTVTIDDKLYKLFLEYLVEGMMNLYYCEIDDQEYYFFERDGKMTEITKKPDMIENGYIVPDNKYKNFLNYYFRDYPTIISTTGKVDFNQKSFINVAKRYHAATCTTGESCIVFENEHPDKDYSLLKVSVYGGLEFNAYSMLDFWGYGIYNKINALSPVFGGKINVYNPRWSKSFGLQAAISLSSLNEKGQAAFEYTAFEYAKIKYELKTIFLTGKLGFEYKFPFKKFRPMLGGGFQYTSNIADNSKVYYSSSAKVSYPYSLIVPGLGYFFNLGAEYALGKHAVFIQSSMEKYINAGGTQKQDEFKTFHIIAGYTF